MKNDLAEVVVHNFPPEKSFPRNFPDDTDHFRVALAEWNYANSSVSGWKEFSDLPLAEAQKVLARAQQLKEQGLPSAIDLDAFADEYLQRMKTGGKQ